LGNERSHGNEAAIIARPNRVRSHDASKREVERLRRIHLFRSWSIITKFVVVNVFILLIALAVAEVILYKQAYRSTIAQSRTTMEYNLLQSTTSVSDKVKLLENVTRIVSSEARIRSFLGNSFITDSAHLEEYRDLISPILDNVMRQNPYIYSSHIFMQNPTIPELYDRRAGFLSMNRIREDPEYEKFIRTSGMNAAWSTIHKEKLWLLQSNDNDREDVFSYRVKIFSSGDLSLSGIVEVDITKMELLQSVEQANVTLRKLGRVFVVDSLGKYVYGNLDESEINSLQNSGDGLTTIAAKGKSNEIQTALGAKSIVISIPVEGPGLSMVGVFPIDRLNIEVRRSIMQMLFVMAAAIVLLSLVVYWATVKLMARMKQLLKAMKQVREESLDVSVPSAGNDEFAQMALSFNHMMHRIHQLLEKARKAELLEKEAELKALEAQINPHFLYNTLATISWTARKANAAETMYLSNALAKYYRLILNKGESETRIENELEMLQVYVHIQKFRFEERFDVVFEIDEQVRGYYTVKNVLQPLVENAIKHGIEPKHSQGTITVQAYLDKRTIIFRVMDDGIGMTENRLNEVLEGRQLESEGSGYALRNIKERLKIYYGEHHRFELFSKPGVGTTVTIALEAREVPGRTQEGGA